MRLAEVSWHDRDDGQAEKNEGEMSAARALLTGIVDYAGLFPPAALDMSAAVQNYARYLGESDAWMLGRFVVPVARLEEFSWRRAAAGGETEWRVSALLTADPESDATRIRAFNESNARRACVDTVEVKATTSEQIERVATAVRGELDVFVEIPLEADVHALVSAIKNAGAKAKIRTGGVVADAIPAPDAVVRFMRACLDAGVAFKATAGLHHPLRAEYRLTYEPDAPSGLLFGYLNVFLAAAFMAHGMTDAAAIELLDERDPAAFQIRDDGVGWRNHYLTSDELRDARERVATSFGSCSFREPVDELVPITSAPA
jgi:hypothetical protein